MIEWFESIDRFIVLTINSWNTPFLDEIMWTISERITWAPLYFLLIYLGFKSLGWKKALLFVACAILAVGLTDFISSGLIKNWVARYRPSHHLLLTDVLHFYTMENGEQYKGGMYGFVSSHAGNFFAIAWMAGWVLKPYYPRVLATLLGVSVVVSFSRIYLGVHYLSDIIGGMVIGTIVAVLVYRHLYNRISKKIESEN
jgi:undecaprenyl-diphosphatase